MRHRIAVATVVLVAGGAGAGAFFAGRTSAEQARPEVLAAPSKPLASVRGLNPGLTLSLLNARRTGGRIVTVRLRVIASRNAHTDALDNLTGLELGEGWGDYTDAIRLVDEADARAIRPIAEPGGRCACSGDVSSLRPGDAVEVFARFAVGSRSRSFALEVPGFPPFDGIRPGE